MQAQATCATKVWPEPDQGIWEARGAPQHYVSSKLMCWVALDRAAKLAEMRGDRSLQATWQATADEIRADVLDHGVSTRGVLRQHYDTDALDASTLLAPIFGFLPGDDDRAHASVLAIADELTESGFVLRYVTTETDDGLSGKEGTFLICSYWLVSALSIVGEHRKARDLFERLCASRRRSGSTPRSSTSPPASTSATSRRPSGTSRSSRRRAASTWPSSSRSTDDPEGVEAPRALPSGSRVEGDEVAPRAQRVGRTRHRLERDGAPATVVGFERVAGEHHEVPVVGVHPERTRIVPPRRLQDGAAAPVPFAEQVGVRGVEDGSPIGRPPVKS